MCVPKRVGPSSRLSMSALAGAQDGWVERGAAGGSTAITDPAPAHRTGPRAGSPNRAVPGLLRALPHPRRRLGGGRPRGVGLRRVVKGRPGKRTWRGQRGSSARGAAHPWRRCADADASGSCVRALPRPMHTAGTGCARLGGRRPVRRGVGDACIAVRGHAGRDRPRVISVGGGERALPGAAVPAHPASVGERPGDGVTAGAPGSATPVRERRSGSALRRRPRGPANAGA